MADTQAGLRVQIAYATPASQVLRELIVAEDTTLHQAIRQSGMLAELAEIDLSVCRVGIHGKLKTLETLLREGDRIEIYRPLVADPKDARRKRASRRETGASAKT
jgi:putative ubiquitin-RnfH superfamily antitoxin RatB of RatAB toxin-antitoxin module